MASYNLSSSIGSPTRLGEIFDNDSNAYKNDILFFEFRNQDHLIISYHQVNILVPRVIANVYYLKSFCSTIRYRPTNVYS
jgi:hypothetical protein